MERSGVARIIAKEAYVSGPLPFFGSFGAQSRRLKSLVPPGSFWAVAFMVLRGLNKPARAIPRAFLVKLALFSAYWPVSNSKQPVAEATRDRYNLGFGRFPQENAVFCPPQAILIFFFNCWQTSFVKCAFPCTAPPVRELGKPGGRLPLKIR